MDRDTYSRVCKKIDELTKQINGGAGSGNFGHAGRPGKRGGSAPEGQGDGVYTRADQIEDQHKAGLITDSEREELLAKAKADGSDKTEVEKPKKEKKAKGTHDLSHTSDSVKKEYLKKYPKDDLGDKLNDITYDDVLEALSGGKNVYEVFGVGDSLIREHIFQMVEEKTGIPYDELYDAWLDSPHKLNERLTQSPRFYELRQQEKAYFDVWRDDEKAAKKVKLTDKEDDERALRDMVHSVWAYDGDKEGSKYLHDPDSYTSLSAKERKKAIDDEWKYLDEHCIHPFAGTDNEGVSYNTTVYAPSKAKKK